MRHAHLFASGFFTLLTLAACGHGPGGSGGGGSGGGGSDPSKGSIVLGVTSDLRVGVDVDRVHVKMSANGSVVKDVDLTAQGTPPLAFPTELRFPSLADGTPVEAKLDAFRPGDGATPLVTRLASTEVVAGKTLLLKAVLDSRCVVALGSSAPVCDAPQTCIAGVCAPEHVPAAALPAYTPDWKNVSNDPCKPAGGGTPVVVVGEGQADYLPMMDGDTAQVEAGPQGGHHIWVAVRAKNLRQSGSITSITGHFPDLDLDVGPFNVIFTMDTDEGGYCKLYGLRFQLDQQYPIDMLLGHPLDVTVTITDPDMDVGIGKRSVVLSQNFVQ
jgi:hypothetical protein